jgi:galacturan 1,4-alpha-galacturonidase
MLISAFLVSCFVAIASARLSCKVPHLGGGRDDGPAINAAFQTCAKNGKVILDQYYLVDSLLFTVGLDDVEIDLSGTCTCLIKPYSCHLILNMIFSAVYSRHR